MIGIYIFTVLVIDIYPRFLDAWYQNPKITYTKSYPFSVFVFSENFLFVDFVFNFFPLKF